MQIVATKDKVVLKPVEQESKTPGGIFIPDQAKEKPSQGLVVSSGNKDIKKGDKVLYPQYAGCPVEIDREKFLILRAEEIMAILEE